MTIEVREIIIKTVVTDDAGPHSGTDPEAMETLIEQIKSELLSDCRELLSDMLEEQAGR